MSILDQILGAEMANEYTDSQRLAYTEKKVLTYDGKSGNRVPWGNEGVYITRVSGEFIDFNSVEEITLTPAVGDPIVVKATPETTFVGTLPGSSFPCMYGSLNGNQAPVIAHITDDLPGTDYGDVMAGTYLCSYENQIMVGYISRVEYGVTVHQIDPKYIPNTVINLCDYGVNVYEILMTAMTTGKLSGRFNTNNFPADVWRSLPTDGSLVCVKNDDGVNPPIIFYGASMGANPSTGRVEDLGLNVKMYEPTLDKIVEFFMRIGVYKDYASQITGAAVMYVIELHDAPTG